MTVAGPGPIRLSDLTWGDVLVDTGDVVVCEATLGDDDVLVKRWVGGALDAELAGREALASAGVPSAALLGHGDGWLVTEDLGQTMWRPCAPGDLEGGPVCAALGAWFARVHAVTPEGLPRPGYEELLGQGLARAVEGFLSTRVRSRLAERVEAWLATSRQGSALVVGQVQAHDVRVVGGGLQAMVDELSQAHRGLPAEDVAVVSGLVGPGAGLGSFRQAYVEAGGSWPSGAELEAVEALDVVLRLAVGALTGDGPDAGGLARLEPLLA